MQAAEGAFSFTEPVISSDSHLSTLPVITSTSTSETYPGSTEVNDMSTWTFPTSYEDHTGTISLSTGTVTVSTLTRKKRPHDTKIENPHHNNHHIETTNETCTETGITSSVSKYTAPTPCTAMPSNEVSYSPLLCVQDTTKVPLDLGLLLEWRVLDYQRQSPSCIATIPPLTSCLVHVFIFQHAWCVTYLYSHGSWARDSSYYAIGGGLNCERVDSRSSWCWTSYACYYNHAAWWSRYCYEAHHL